MHLHGGGENSKLVYHRMAVMRSGCLICRKGKGEEEEAEVPEAGD